MKLLLAITVKTTVSLLVGWMVNQLPAVADLPFSVNPAILILLAAIVTALLVFIDKLISEVDSSYEDLGQIFQAFLVACLSSIGILLAATVIALPNPGQNILRISALLIFLWGALVSFLKGIEYKNKKAKDLVSSEIERISLAVKIALNNLLPQTLGTLRRTLGSDLFSEYARENLEQNSYLLGRLNELKQRLDNRKLALEFLGRLTKDKFFSEEVSQRTFNRLNLTFNSSTVEKCKREAYRRQIRAIVDAIYESVNYGSSEVLDRVYMLIFSRRILDGKSQIEGFTIFREYFLELALLEGLNRGAIAQVEDYFERLSELFEANQTVLTNNLDHSDTG